MRSMVTSACSTVGQVYGAIRSATSSASHDSCMASGRLYVVAVRDPVFLFMIGSLVDGRLCSTGVARGTTAGLAGRGVQGSEAVDLVQLVHQAGEQVLGDGYALLEGGVGVGDDAGGFEDLVHDRLLGRWPVLLYLNR